LIPAGHIVEAEIADLAGIRRDFTLADLLAETTAAGIDSTILVQVLPDLDETWDFLTLAAGSELVAAGGRMGRSHRRAHR